MSPVNYFAIIGNFQSQVRLTITSVKPEKHLEKVTFLLSETLQVGQEISLKVGSDAKRHFSDSYYPRTLSVDLFLKTLHGKKEEL